MPARTRHRGLERGRADRGREGGVIHMPRHCDLDGFFPGGGGGGGPKRLYHECAGAHRGASGGRFRKEPHSPAVALNCSTVVNEA